MKHNLTADKILTENQAEILLKEVEKAKDEAIETGKKLKYINDYYLFFFAYYTGLRVSELTELKWQDFGEDYVMVRMGKGKKSRTVYFGDKTKCEKIHFQNVQKKLFKRQCEQKDHIFIGQRGPLGRVAAHMRLKYWVERLGLPDSISMHSHRHGYATRLLDNGVPLQLVRDQLGHSNISVTSTYLHFTEEAKQKLKKVL